VKHSLCFLRMRYSPGPNEENSSVTPTDITTYSASESRCWILALEVLYAVPHTRSRLIQLYNLEVARMGL